ncbi:MAG TPA: hypothetical protein GXX51_02220 [Firmicutes bacterium]|nr:hypothetical protein [Bacillota bacterium]
MSPLYLAIERLERGNILEAVQAIQQVCERRASYGLCRAACEKCRLEQARQALLSGHATTKVAG